MKLPRIYVMFAFSSSIIFVTYKMAVLLRIILHFLFTLNWKGMMNNYNFVRTSKDVSYCSLSIALEKKAFSNENIKKTPL